MQHRSHHHYPAKSLTVTVLVRRLRRFDRVGARRDRLPIVVLLLFCGGGGGVVVVVLIAAGESGYFRRRRV